MLQKPAEEAQLACALKEGRGEQAKSHRRPKIFSHGGHGGKQWRLNEDGRVKALPVQTYLHVPGNVRDSGNRYNLSSGKTVRAKSGRHQRPGPPTLRGKAWGKVLRFFYGI